MYENLNINPPYRNPLFFSQGKDMHFFIYLFTLFYLVSDDL
jgi:hypothetical protein